MPWVDKMLAINKWRERYLADYIQPKNKPLLQGEHKAKFDRLYALHGDKTDIDIEDPDPMGLAGHEQTYFFDKPKNVLDHLGLGSKGSAVESRRITSPSWKPPLFAAGISFS